MLFKFFFDENLKNLIFDETNIRLSRLNWNKFLRNIFNELNKIISISLSKFSNMILPKIYDYTTHNDIMLK